MFKYKTYLAVAILSMLALVAGACAQPAPTPVPTPTPTPTPVPVPTPTPAITGTLKVYVTDAPPREEVTGIMVTISEVQVHKALAEQEREQEQQQSGSGNQTQEGEQEQQQTQQGEGEWITIDLSDNATTFDLLQIRGIEQYLGTSEVEAAKYTQVRLVVETVQVEFNNSGDLKDARIPSKELKIVHPFSIIDGETTALVIDFDADRMVTVTGSGDIIVKPVVKLTDKQEKSSGQKDKTKQEVALEDTNWSLQSYGEPGNLKDILTDTEITAEFVSSEGTVKGSAGCNSYFGSYQVEGSKLSIPGPIGATEMYCMEPEGIMEQEQQYLTALGAAESYKIENGRLQINCGNQILIFERTEITIQNAADARDAAIAYLQTISSNTPNTPNSDADWQETDVTTPGLVGGVKMQYVDGEWTVGVAYNVVRPDLTEYQVVISNDQLSVHWEAMVKADGTVTETK